jgi:hypothetical protein
LSWFDEHDDWSKCVKGLKYSDGNGGGANGGGGGGGGTL